MTDASTDFENAQAPPQAAVDAAGFHLPVAQQASPEPAPDEAGAYVGDWPADEEDSAAELPPAEPLSESDRPQSDRPQSDRPQSDRASPSAPPAQAAPPPPLRPVELAEAFAAGFASSAAPLAHAAVRVRFAGLAQLSWAEFVGSVRDRSFCFAVHLSAGLTGSAPAQAWLEISPPAAFALIESMLGWTHGQVYVPARPLTDLERGLLGRVVQANQPVDATSAAPGTQRGTGILSPRDVPPVAAVEAQGQDAPGTHGFATANRACGGQDARATKQAAGTTHPHAQAARTPLPRADSAAAQADWPPADQSAAAQADWPPADQSAAVLAASYDVAVGPQVGGMRLCVAVDPTQAQALTRPLGRPCQPLEISVTTEYSDISPADLAELAPGDILTSQTPVDGDVIVRAAGIPTFTGRLGACDGQRAVTIRKKVGEMGEDD